MQCELPVDTPDTPESFWAGLGCRGPACELISIQPHTCVWLCAPPTGYGFLILHALVTDIEPAHKVKEAMNEINAARRMRVAAAENAEAHKVRLDAFTFAGGCCHNSLTYLTNS